MQEKIPNTILTVLQTAALADWKQRLMIGLFFSGSGILIAYYFAEHGLFIYVLSALFIGFGLSMMIYCFIYHKWEHQAAYRALVQKPEDAVWVYSLVIQLMPFGLSVNEKARIVIRTIDKDEICIDIPASHLKAIMLFLNKRLDHATFGYSEEKAQWYAASPHLMKQ